MFLQNLIGLRLYAKWYITRKETNLNNMKRKLQKHPLILNYLRMSAKQYCFKERFEDRQETIVFQT